MSLMLNPETALAGAQAAWAEIAPRIKLDPSAYALSMVRARLKEKAKRIVVRLESPDQPTLILKQNLDGVHRNHFQNSILAHRRAMEVFDGQENNHVPGLLYVDEGRQLAVMEHAPGYTAHDAIGLALSANDRAYVLRACGAWMEHWHKTTYVRDNKVNPNAMQKFVGSQLKRVDEGALMVPEKASFQAFADAALKTAEKMRGKVTKLSATHGDMNSRNLILGPEGTFGLDFGAIHNAPIGHDLARFFVNFANFHFPQDAEPGDPTWLAQDHDSFFEGYGKMHQEDPSFHYLMRTQVLKEWASIPKDPEKRNNLHKRRWKGTKLLAQLLY